METKSYIGIDIALKKFDATLYRDGNKLPHKVFSNNPQGFAECFAWCKHNSGSTVLHLVMEATNIYWQGLAHFAYEQGAAVSVINPRRIKAYAKAVGQHGKTDKLDAALLSRFGAKEQPTPWHPPKNAL